MINSKIIDGHGTGARMKVDAEGTANVVVHPHPPLDDALVTIPFSQFFTSDGTAKGSNNMIANATLASPAEFFIKASNEYDIYINRITIQVSDPNATLLQFGALPALANGVQWFFRNNANGLVVISTAWKTNLDIFRDATSGKEFGASNSAWLVDIAGGGGEDTYFPVIDLEDAFGVQWGVRLRKNSDDRLGFLVRDNLTGLSVFNIKGYGIRF